MEWPDGVLQPMSVKEMEDKCGSLCDKQHYIVSFYPRPVNGGNRWSVGKASAALYLLGLQSCRHIYEQIS